MPPLAFLLLMISLTTGTAAAVSIVRNRRQRALRALAIDAGFQYSAVDRFGLLKRLIAPGGPMEGLPIARVSDVFYKRDEPRHTLIVSLEIATAHGEAPIRRIVRLRESGSTLVVEAQRTGHKASALLAHFHELAKE